MLRLLRYTILTVGTFFFLGEIFCDQYHISSPLVSSSDGTNNYWYNSIEISCQIDTSRKDRDRREPKKEETKTERVRKPEDRKSEEKEEAKESFSQKCLSSCLIGIFDGCITMIFSGGDKKDSLENKSAFEKTMTQREYENYIKKRADSIATVRQHDTVRGEKLDSLQYIKPDSIEYISSRDTSVQDTSKTDIPPPPQPIKTVEVAPLQLKDENEKRDSMKLSQEKITPVSPVKIEPMPSLKKEPYSQIEYEDQQILMHWTRFHAGLMLGGSYMWGVNKDEYDSLNFWLRINGGFLLSRHFEINIHTNFAWYSGTPEFDYNTKTEYPNGDVREIISQPEDISFRTTSYGVGIRLLLPFTESTSVIGLGLGITGSYVKFYEKSKVYQEEYFKGVLEKQETKEITRKFNNISYAFDLGLFFTDPRFPWWGELMVGIEIFDYEPSRTKPFSLDWSGYRGQFIFGLGFKYRIFEM